MEEKEREEGNEIEKDIQINDDIYDNGTNIELIDNEPLINIINEDVYMNL